MHFEAIYREHFASLWRAVQRFGVPERDAADATQEVFVIAHRRFSEFEGRSSLRTWLFGIAFRVAAGRRRRASEQREVLEPAGAEARPDPADDPEALAMRRELRGLLQLGLAALPIEQRAVFTLFELEGFSGEEIADALSESEGTVRSRLRLARATFSRVVKAALASDQRILNPQQVLEAAHE
ncbi:MAG TPA: sigma-70 family RNA polymerase sigma factor [Polyangiaceae bacterium]|nr:sigma-70 family RNA polymerase sigma factor [Polyangiaceae bacterium]